MAKLVFEEDKVSFGVGIYVENQNAKKFENKYYIDFLVNFKDTEERTECLMFTEREVKQFFIKPFTDCKEKNIIKDFPGEVGQLYYTQFNSKRIGYIGKLEFETSQRVVYIPKYIIEKALERAKKNGEDVTEEQSVSKFFKDNISKFLNMKIF